MRAVRVGDHPATSPSRILAPPPASVGTPPASIGRFSGPRFQAAVRAARIGLVVNAALAITKFVAGVLGHSYALIADAVESTADILSSFIVWGGLTIAAQPADDNHPYGHGKAEPLAAAVVALMLVGAAIAIAIAAVREIVTPHHAPAPFTLVVLVAVVLIKELLFRSVLRVGRETGSVAVEADAWHHRTDAITSGAAFVGISVALIKGPGWEAADDWAALFAAGIIAINGVRILRPAVADLMDRAPNADVLRRIASAAASVENVRAIEKLMVRKAGTGHYVDVHVQADPSMSLQEAHVLSGRVKSAIRSAEPAVLGVLIHMEPYETDEE
ncbi:MAG: cation diffusion facilitator family transporter [Gemmatimonadota bacterium]|nr:cation diffusion facilitator family transporter [Gemmatimonadota bacterium]